MLESEKNQLIKDIDYLKKVVLDSTDIQEFEEFLFYKNEIGSTLQGINKSLSKEFF